MTGGAGAGHLTGMFDINAIRKSLFDQNIPGLSFKHHAF
jgi:hypothetical protein